MKILVTGGAGFIGSHVVDAYVGAGHEVIVLDNLSTGKEKNLNLKAKFYKCDVCSEEAAGIIQSERPEIVNHHAAQIDVRKSISDPKNDCRINVLGFLNLMEAARKSGVKKVVFASSGGAIYGEQVEYPATEDHPTNPVNPYGISKLVSEKYLEFYKRQYGISFAALRYANVYGPRQNGSGEGGVVAVFISKILRDEKLVINGDGKQTRDYVYVGDVVKANLEALTDDLNGVYNIGTGVETDVETVFKMIRDRLGRGDESHGPALEGEQRRSVIVSNRWKRNQDKMLNILLSDGISETVGWFKNAYN